MADMWHVTGQRQNTQLNPAGNGFQDVWEVSYMVDSGPATGTTGKVTVPQPQYTPENVAGMIDAQVEAHDRVASL